MRLTVNGESYEFVDEVTVSELLEYLNLSGQFVAVECNHSIISYKTFQTAKLCDGDVVELVTLVGGG
ncbi:MAG: sulfur carrier protein ThiS [Planctomycetaceae bacterium]|jgi:thiamine biosynthesis protein ThiS|nr:sulfur carrier protein ThiS [Planctomycetaceae bacterium]